MAALLHALLPDDTFGAGHWADARRPRAAASLARAPASIARAHANLLAPLVATVEAEVVPRLILARASRQAPSPRPAHTETNQPAMLKARVPAPSALRVIRDCAACARAPDPEPLTRLLDRLSARGMNEERLFLEVLAPAARRLGDAWCEDECDFAAVTLGTSRLQQAMHALESGFHASGPRQHDQAPDANRRALLAACPGEQHDFGVAMLAAFLRRAGWSVARPLIASPGDLARHLARPGTTLVGLSLSAERHLTTLATCIRTARRAVRGRQVGIMVGGDVFNEKPELAALIGADATASDGAQAVLQAERLLAVLPICA